MKILGISICEKLWSLSNQRRMKKAGFSKLLTEVGENELLAGIYKEVCKRNYIFHIIILCYEVLMLLMISMRPGGPFLKPRRTAYFSLYICLILATVLVLWIQKHMRRSGGDFYRIYFKIENWYLVFLNAWGIAITLNDQLGGNSLTVYTYTTALTSIVVMMEPYKMALMFLGGFSILNIMLPFFPDPAGLDHTFNNLTNSLFITIVGIGIAGSFYNSRIRAKANEILVQRQNQEMQSKTVKLEKEVNCDALTYLQNRNGYQNAVRELKGMKCDSNACIYFDVNGLHEINNSLGHDAGDLMLKTVAQAIAANFRSTETFRIGGDEFVVLCKNIAQQALIRRVDSIAEQVRSCGYSVSIGIEWRDKNLDIDEIILEAERRMQEDKAEYYSSGGSERQTRIVNERMEKMLAEKRDAEHFLSVLAPAFKGVYFVNIKNDTLRQIFIPPYFKEILEQTHQKYKAAIKIYIQRYVKEEYISHFDAVLDYERLGVLLEEEGIYELEYEKRDEERVKLSIMKFKYYAYDGEETLWIFSDASKSNIFTG